MDYSSDRALAFLRLGTGQPDAEFRDEQEDAIRHVVEGRGRLLVVQKTGWGKSFVYFIATKLLREAGTGPALLISPLLSLMRNQIAAAERMGVRASRITSDNEDEWRIVEAGLRKDEVDILLISPERLGNEYFRSEVLASVAGRIALLVIDEAHCISDWGHDFRPHYRLIERIARALPANLRLLATTATANNRVMDDLQAVLGPDLEVKRGDLNRPSLMLQTIRLARQSERLSWLAEQVPRLPGHGIVYTLTVRDAVQVAEWLQSRGIQAEAYTGRSEDREQLEQRLLDNRVKALVATTALGMGFDKPDLGFVIHYQAPGSVVAYYQQVGRAGRALAAAYGVLLSGEEDTDITSYFIEGAFPTPDEVEQVLGALNGAPEGLSVPELLGEVNISRGRIEKTIALLSLESPAPIARVGPKWQLTPEKLGREFWDRAARLTDLRRGEQRQLQEYVALETGHMDFLIRALDGESEDLQLPDLRPLPTEIAPDVLRQALAFLRRTCLPIAPRKQWPSPGGLPKYGVRGRIGKEHLAEEGRALSIWRDSGWGELVRDGKYRDGGFADELVGACLELMERWAPDPAPEWMACTPSRRRPELVPDFAERLAKRMDLRFLPVLEAVREADEQKGMQNSTQQARNVDGVFTVARPPLSGPVLLVDDLVDSRWTLTVAAWLLRSNGSGPVWPLSLASAGHD